MKLSVENKNYCATVVTINQLVPLEKCDKLQGAIILGNQVIVGLDVKPGTRGIYIPVETQLAAPFISINNMFRDKELNADKTTTGYFELNGRVKCISLRGNRSEGLFIELEKVEKFLSANGVKVTSFDDNTDFDAIDGVKLCNKYTVTQRQNNAASKPKNKATEKESKIVKGQFRFHQDTEMLYKNIWKLKPDERVDISYKLHGTSGISSNILCSRELSFIERMIQKLGLKVDINTSEYSNIYSSRKVIKNDGNSCSDFYGSDIWGMANDRLKKFLTPGMTLYYEIVGHIPGGKCIQDGYDYGCKKDEFEVYVYRITITDKDGNTHEFSPNMIDNWCRSTGVKHVPRLFDGTVRQLYTHVTGNILDESSASWRDELLAGIRKLYNDKDCHMCTGKVPEEGCVIRLDKLGLEAYKCKSNRFYERETKELDKGKSDIESEN